MGAQATKGNAHMAHKPHIVIVGENASLNMGGEASKPFQFFRLYTAEGRNCTLITSARCRDELRRRLPYDDFIKLIFVPDSWILKLLEKIRTNQVSKLFARAARGLQSLYFLVRARPIVNALAREYPNMVVHQPTPISPLLPTYIGSRRYRSYLGPLSGAPGLPRKGGFNWPYEFSIQLAKVSNWFIRGKHQAALLFSSGPPTTKRLRRVLGDKIPIVETLENAVEDHWFTVNRKVEGERPCFLTVNRLVDWKRVDLILRASAEVQRCHRLLVVGDGPERQRLEQLADSLGLDHVEFLDWMSHQEIAARYASATGLISASLNEAGGTSLQEGMAAGVPVIATAWGGHLSRVTPKAGLLIQPGEDEAMVDDIASGMRRLIDDPAFAAELGSEGRRRAYGQMRWASKANLFLHHFDTDDTAPLEAHRSRKSHAAETID